MILTFWYFTAHNLLSSVPHAINCLQWFFSLCKWAWLDLNADVRLRTGFVRFTQVLIQPLQLLCQKFLCAVPSTYYICFFCPIWVHKSVFKPFTLIWISTVVLAHLCYPSVSWILQLHQALGPPAAPFHFTACRKIRLYRFRPSKPAWFTGWSLK